MTSDLGPLRHFAAMQHFSRFWSEADIEPFSVHACQIFPGS
jgi:hypothetical protein